MLYYKEIYNINLTYINTYLWEDLAVIFIQNQYFSFRYKTLQRMLQIIVHIEGSRIRIGHGNTWILLKTPVIQKNERL